MEKGGKIAAAAGTGTSRKLKLKKSFKLGLRSLLTASSIQGFTEAFPSFTTAEQERLHRLFIQEFYIVFLEDHLVDQELLLQQRHINILTSLKGCEDDARESLVYSYTKSFNAFAAELHEHEANRLSGMDGVLSVFQNKYHQLHTTESWDFIGLTQNTKRRLKMERDIIVGLLDTGIHRSISKFYYC